MPKFTYSHVICHRYSTGSPRHGRRRHGYHSVERRGTQFASKWSSLGRQCQADIIPAVQQRLLHQIQNGEFVEFHLLLPSHAPPLTNNYLVDLVDNNAGEHSISIGKTHSRVKIANFQSWLKAWNIYLRCMIHFHSHLTTQLLYYQSQITTFASIYTFQSWSLYDRSFRLQLASKAIADGILMMSSCDHSI